MEPFCVHVWFVEKMLIIVTQLHKVSTAQHEGIYKCDALRDLVPFVKFKKREKNPWRSVNFSKVAGLRLHGCLLVYLTRSKPTVNNYHYNNYYNNVKTKLK